MTCGADTTDYCFHWCKEKEFIRLLFMDVFVRHVNIFPSRHFIETVELIFNFSNFATNRL